jgi:hypothetical protein
MFVPNNKDLGLMGYTKEWWEENKARVLRERREKYENDPEYRARVLERTRRNREKKAAERQDALRNFKINGVPVKLLSLRETADKLGVEPDRLKYYQKQGYIPKALVTKPNRFYTPVQVEYMRQLTEFLTAHGKDLRRPTSPPGKAAIAALEGLCKTIHENWETA